MTVLPDKKEISLYSPQLIGLMRAVHDRGGVFRFKARGFSMSPFIRDGDILTVARPAGGYRVGEVVAFVRPGCDKLAVHRIAGRRGGCFLIKGDNCSDQDGWFSASDILGRVTRVERRSRDVSGGLGIFRRPVAALSRWCLLPILLFPPRLLRSFSRCLTTGVFAMIISSSQGKNGQKKEKKHEE